MLLKISCTVPFQKNFYTLFCIELMYNFKHTTISEHCFNYRTHSEQNIFKIVFKNKTLNIDYEFFIVT